MKKQYVINIFGTGKRCFHIQLEYELFEKLDAFRKQKECSWNTILQDVGILEGHGVNNIEELTTGTPYWQIPLTSSNRLEIKRSNTKLLKMNAVDLLQEDLLFPLYQTETNEVRTVNADRTFLIQSTETGLLCKFKLDLERFDIDELVFLMSDNQDLNDPFLNGLRYCQRDLVSVKEDTVSRSVVVLPCF